MVLQQAVEKPFETFFPGQAIYMQPTIGKGGSDVRNCGSASHNFLGLAGGR